MPRPFSGKTSRIYPAHVRTLQQLLPTRRLSTQNSLPRDGPSTRPGASCPGSCSPIVSGTRGPITSYSGPRTQRGILVPIYAPPDESTATGELRDFSGIGARASGVVRWQVSVSQRSNTMMSSQDRRLLPGRSRRLGPHSERPDDRGPAGTSTSSTNHIVVAQGRRAAVQHGTTRGLVVVQRQADNAAHKGVTCDRR